MLGINNLEIEKTSQIILVVDDDRAMRILLRRAMEQEGYQVEEAQDGEQCLAAYQRLSPHIILMDAMMPIMDGFTCCIQLKQMEKKHDRQTPVLMITGLDDPKSVDRAFDAGAIDYVTKPIHWPVLRQRVRRLLEASRAMEELRQQTQRERLMLEMQESIRQSLNLKEILNTTVQEVQKFLATDRVIIYSFQSNWYGTVIVESVASGWLPMVNLDLKDFGFSNSENFLSCSIIQQYQQGYCQAINDIQQVEVEPCYVNLLAHFQIRASLIVPILQESNPPSSLYPASSEWSTINADFFRSPMSGASVPPYNSQQGLWGLLIAHQCSGPRRWQQSEIDLVKRLATQVAIAIKQAQLYQKLEEANRELQRLSTSDSLTGLANRRRFDQYFEWEWVRLSREPGYLSLIICDLDFFKTYNDTYGHQAGDSCLQQVADAIRMVARRASDLVARYGGEEFAVILPNTDLGGAVQVAEIIRAEVAQLKISHPQHEVKPSVTLSLGVASTIPNPHSFPAQLIAAADTALYQAKAQGRNRVVGTNYSTT